MAEPLGALLEGRWTTAPTDLDQAMIAFHRLRALESSEGMSLAEGSGAAGKQTNRLSEQPWRMGFSARRPSPAVAITAAGEPPTPPEQPPEEPAAAVAEMPLLSSTEAFLQQDRQRRSEEYARHAMNMFAAAKQMLLTESPAPTGRKQRSKKQRQKQEAASAYKLGAGKRSLSLEVR